MSFLFQNSQWAWALLIALAPLIVHLIARIMPPSYHFSSNYFLKQIIKKTARWQKPKDFLLLLLRTLAILMLILAILGLTLFSQKPLDDHQATQTSIIIVDRSASMMAQESGTSRFDLACKEAHNYLRSKKPEHANLVWIDAHPKALYPTPGTNLSHLHNELKHATPRPESGLISAALQLALTQLQSSEGKKELLIYSDFQATAWRDIQLPENPNITIRKVAIGSRTPENLAVLGLTCTPSRPIMGQNLQIQARLANYTAAPRRQLVTLDLGGQRQSTHVEVAAWGEAEALFQVQPDRTGKLPVTVALEPDGFSADDQRHCVIEVRDSLQLLVLGENTSSLPIWKALGAALPWLSVSSSASLQDALQADFVFVEEWSDHLDLSALIDNPNLTLLLQPVSPFSETALNALSPGWQLTDQQLNSVREKDGWSTLIASPDHSSFSVFKNGEFGNPVEGVFRKRFLLPSVSTEQGDTLVTYQDQVPALAQIGRHLIWNMSLSREHSTWSDQTPFLPYIAELLLSVQPSPSLAQYDFPPGSNLSWTPSREVPLGASVQLHRDSENDIEISKETTATGARYLSDARAIPGLYQWSLSSQPLSYTAVNLPEGESDLRTLNPSDLTGQSVSSQELLQEIALGDGMPLAPWLLLLAATFLLGESLLSNLNRRSLQAKQTT